MRDIIPGETWAIFKSSEGPRYYKLPFVGNKRGLLITEFFEKKNFVTIKYKYGGKFEFAEVHIDYLDIFEKL